MHIFQSECRGQPPCEKPHSTPWPDGPFCYRWADSQHSLFTNTEAINVLVWDASHSNISRWLFRSGWAAGHRTSLYSPIPIALSQGLLGLSLFMSYGTEDLLLLPEPPSTSWMTPSLSLLSAPQRRHSTEYFSSFSSLTGMTFSPYLFIPSRQLPKSRFLHPTTTQLLAGHSSLDVSSLRNWTSPTMNLWPFSSKPQFPHLKNTGIFPN